MIRKSILFLLSVIVCSAVYAADLNRELIVEPDDYAKPMLRIIKSAKKDIKISMYELITDLNGKCNESVFMKALVKAHEKGVKVSLILNDFYNSDWPASGKKVLDAEVAWANANGIDYCLSSSAFTYTHNKYMIIDNKTVCIMTGNLSQESFPKTGYERNFFIVNSDPEIVSYLIKLFNADIKNAANNTGITPVNKPADLLVTSNSLGEEVIQYIQNFILGSSKSLDIYMMYFGDDCPPEILNAITQVANNGIPVRIICSNVQDPKIMEGLVEQAPHINYTIVPDGETFIHTKTFIRDSKNVLLGSINMSESSITSNREVDMKVVDVDFVNQIQRTFNGDWDKYKGKNNKIIKR